MTDSQLASDVQTLNSLSLAKNDVSQQQALIDEVLTNQAPVLNLNPGFIDFSTESSLRVANQDELTTLGAFHSTATVQESALFDAQLGPGAPKLASETPSPSGIFSLASKNPSAALSTIAWQRSSPHPPPSPVMAFCASIKTCWIPGGINWASATCPSGALGNAPGLKTNPAETNVFAAR